VFSSTLYDRLINRSGDPACADNALTQAEETQYRNDDNHETDDVDDVVHKKSPCNGVMPVRQEWKPLSGVCRCFNNRCQTWKLSPQPQRPFSFGLVKVKPAVRFFTS
jgi:hypothetical protein